MLRHLHVRCCHRCCRRRVPRNPGSIFQIGDESLFKCCGITASGDRLGRIADQHLAGVHQRNPVAVLRLIHEMGGDEDGDIIVAREIGEDLPEAVPRHRVDTRGRLIEDENIGRMDHRHRQRQPLPDAKRQVVRQRVHDRAKIETLRHFGDTRLNCLFRQLEQAGVQIKVLPHRQFRIEREGLAHVTDAVADRHVARIHLVSEELRLSFAGGQKARQHLHGGGFSAAIGAEKAKNLAARNLEADIVDGGEIAETHAKVGCLDGIITLTGRLSWRDMDFVVILALFFGKKRDEGGVEIGCRGAVEKFGGRAGG